MRKFALFLFAVFIVLMFGACSKSEKPGQIEIEFITNRPDFVNGVGDKDGKVDPSTAYFKILADKFEKETGIKIKLSGYGDYHAAYKRRLASGDYGDVITTDNITSEQDLKEFFRPIGTKSDFENYRFTNMAEIGNDVYGLSTGYYMNGIIYNKKVFAEAGYKEFPKTFAELRDAFAKIKKNGQIPVILNRGEKWPLAWIQGIADNIAGERFFNRMWMSNAPFSKNEPLGKVLFEIKDWIRNGWVEPEFIPLWGESLDKVASAKAGMIFCGTFALVQIQHLTIQNTVCTADDIGFALIPKWKAEDKYQFVCEDPESPLLVSKKTKHFEAAKKWLEYVVASGIYERNGALPILKNQEPEMKTVIPILKKIQEDKVQVIYPEEQSKYKGERSTEILKDMELYSDVNYVGRALDAARVSDQAFNEFMNQLNSDFAKYKAERGYDKLDI